MPEDVRKHLIDRLDMYGLHHALDQIENGTSGAIALKRPSSRSSGIEQLELPYHEQFLEHRSDALLASSALDALDDTRLCRDDDPAEAEALIELRNESEAVLDTRDARARRARSAPSILTGEVEIPPELAEDFKRAHRRPPALERLGVPTPEPARNAYSGNRRHQALARFAFDEASPKRMGLRA